MLIHLNDLLKQIQEGKVSTLDLSDKEILDYEQMSVLKRMKSGFDFSPF